MKTDSKNTTST